jgi:hypothetical protein
VPGAFHGAQGAEDEFDALPVGLNAALSHSNLTFGVQPDELKFFIWLANVFFS